MAELRFSHGVMSAGKSALALQVEHTRTDAGSALSGPEVRYQVLCRRHWARRETARA